MTDAPLRNDLAEGPPDAHGFWLTTKDGTRIRAGAWNASGSRGTVVLLPGRTEYIEKYGRAAAVLADAGYVVLSVDWRGQGMSDRAISDRMVGHVVDFAEFQDDLDTLLNFARAQGLAEPYHLLAHSMGGCIGLRALMRGVTFASAVFSSPMWGILLPVWQRPLALPLATAACALGLGHKYAPGTGPATYVVDSPFEGNTLTTDPDMWDYMRRQAVAMPEQSLGGPSLNWLHAALVECDTLSRMPSPSLPTMCGLGSLEKIVDTGAIQSRMKGWKNGRLERISGAEHEILMERPLVRAKFLGDAIALFST